MASEKKPFWKKALRVFAYGVGAAAIAAGVMVAIAATHGAAAPFLGVAWGAIVGSPAIAAGVAVGAAALGFAGVGAYFASKSGRAKERKQARRLAKAEKLYAQAGRPDMSLSHAHAQQMEMGYAQPAYYVAPPLPPLVYDAPKFSPKLSLTQHLSSYPTQQAAHRHTAHEMGESMLISPPSSRWLGR